MLVVGLPRATVIDYFTILCELLPPLELDIVLPENHMWVFLRSKRHYYSKNFLRRKKPFSDGPISFYLDHLVSTRVSKFTYGFFIGLKTRSHLRLGLGGSVGFSVLSYPRWIVEFFLKSLSTLFKKINCRILKLWRWRNSEDSVTRRQILRLVYEFLLFLFGVIVETSRIPCGQTNLRRWYQWVLSKSSIWRPSPSRFPRTEENNAVASPRSTPNNDTTNLSVTSGFIFP